MPHSIGEMFILGFRGATIPTWVEEFSSRFGLGGVLLFDYDCLDKKYERNVFNPEQVRKLCADIHALSSRPLVFVDQEGGKVRRLKEKYGFSPLVSAKNFPTLNQVDRISMIEKSFNEMKSIGIDVNLAPVIDVDYNPTNPDIGAVERSFSPDIKVVEESALLYADAGRKMGLGLCLKHFPGMGGANKNAHNDLTDISHVIKDEQTELFKKIVQKIPGKMILLSHGIVNQWEKGTPVSMSKVALDKIKSWDTEILTISDDMQMQGLQKVMNTADGCVKAVGAGIDFLCIGNNLMDEQNQCAGFAEKLLETSEKNPAMKTHIREATKKIQTLKSKLTSFGL